MSDKSAPHPVTDAACGGCTTVALMIVAIVLLLALATVAAPLHGLVEQQRVEARR